MIVERIEVYKCHISWKTLNFEIILCTIVSICNLGCEEENQVWVVMLHDFVGEKYCRVKNYSC